MQSVVDANIESLQQLVSLIEHTPEDTYLNGNEGLCSSVGRHVRHVLDHYLAIQNAVESGTVDYDIRSRDCELESNKDLALEKINIIIAWLQNQIKGDCDLDMKTEVSVSQQQSITIKSSLCRELIYLLNHTLHHSAYISLALRSLGLAVDQHIGVAPATGSYLRNNQIQQVG